MTHRSRPLTPACHGHAGMLLLGWMLAFVVAMRAMVPLGFMPEQHDSAPPVLALSLCLSNGLSPEILDALAPEPTAPAAPPEASHTLACAFTLLAFQPLLPSLPGLRSGWRQLWPVQSRASTSALLHQPAIHGPPLGSRAPPALV